MGEQHDGGFCFPPAGDNDTFASNQIEMYSDAILVEKPHQVAAPVEPGTGRMDIERFATDRITASIRNREHFIPGSPPRAKKKSRPTSEAQRDVVDRQAISHDRLDGGIGSPSTVSIAKKPGFEMDADMGDLRVLSAILCRADGWH